MIILRPPILDAVEAKGFKVFEGEYDLNIIGIRSKNTKAGKFDDVVCVVYKKNGLWQVESFVATCDPGVYWLKDKKKKGNKKGTAVIVSPGQYRGLWTIDKHSGRYPALCQRGICGPVSVWRDANKDDKIDRDGKVETGHFSINLHRAHGAKEVENVGPYSAGCVVLHRSEDLDRILWLAKKQIAHHPTWKTFTFTILDE